MPRDYDDDRPKPSWREVDKKKDSSKHRQEERKPISPFQKVRADSASKVYKAKLDAFFEGEGKAPDHVKGKLNAIETKSEEGIERAAALKLIKDAVTSKDADKAVEAYLEEWELPTDFEILSQTLLCSNEYCVGKAMDMLLKMLEDKRVPKRVQILEQRLRRIKTLIDDEDLEKKALDLIKALRLFS